MYPVVWQGIEGAMSERDNQNDKEAADQKENQMKKQIGDHIVNQTDDRPENQIEMNIVAAVNDKFVKPLKVMLYSLACNTERELKIYLMYCDLSEKNIVILQRFVQEKCHGQLIPVPVDQNAFREHDATKSMFSVETFYRLFIPYLLPEDVNRALWLDADMIVCGNIDDFYDSSFYWPEETGCGEDSECAQQNSKSGRTMHEQASFSRQVPGKEAFLVAAWNDRDREKFHEYKERLGEDLKTDAYFNSGVVLYNIPAIRRRLTSEEIMEFWHTRQPKLKFLDQDILNCLFGTETILKDSTIYNNQAHADEDAKEQLEKARVIHYITYRKPWKLYYEGSGDRIFWNYARKCGFMGEYLGYRLLHGPVMVVYRIYKRVRYH